MTEVMEGELKYTKDGKIRQRAPATCSNCGQMGHRSDRCSEPVQADTTVEIRDEAPVDPELLTHTKDGKVRQRALVTCSHCGLRGHNKVGCPERKSAQASQDRKMKDMLEANKPKRFVMQDHKSLKPLLDRMTAEGCEAALNGRQIKSAHFINPVKPEAAACESLIEPFLDSIKKHADTGTNWSREPVFTTYERRTRTLDYILVTNPSVSNTRKWLIEAESPNRTHKGIEQVEEFLASVPNLNEYGFIVTDGYHYHFLEPLEDGRTRREWRHTTIRRSGRLKSMITGHWLSAKVAFTGAMGLFVGLYQAGRIYGIW